MSGTLKPPDRRQRRNQRPGLALVRGEGAAMEPPAPPKGLLKVTREWWAELWASDLAGAFEPSDVGALRRLAEMYDKRERALRAYRRHRMVEGSMGQPVVNPIWNVTRGLDAEIGKLEDRFGLTARSRLQLGVSFGEAHQSLAELTAAMAADDGDGAAGEDPFAEGGGG